MRPQNQNLVHKSDDGGLMLLIRAEEHNISTNKNRLYEVLAILLHPIPQNQGPK